MLLNPKEVSLLDDDGKSHKYLVSKIPAVQCREIMAKYPLTAFQQGIMPKQADYAGNEEIMLKLLSYAAVPGEKGRQPIRLETVELINNHCPDFVASTSLEWEMLKYNWSFLRAGKALLSLESLFQKALEHFTKTLISSLQHSLKPNQPPS